MEKYQQIMEKLDIDYKIIDKLNENKILISNNIYYPKCSFGFFHFLHASNNKLDVLSSFENKKKVFLVTNEFEKKIDDYDESIQDVLIKKYKIKDNNISRNFIKLWEILHHIKSEKIFNKNMTFLIISSNPYNYCQSLIFYRKNKKHKDNYNIVKLSNLTFNYDLDDNKINEHPVDNINNINKLNIKADLIIIDVNRIIEINSKNRNVREQLLFPYIFSTLVNSIAIQSKDGMLICKFYETFTITSAKLLNILGYYYDELQFIHPFTTRNIRGEKFLICYKYNGQTNKLNVLNKIADKILSIPQKTVDICPEYNITDNFVKSLKNINIKISQNQFSTINKMISFVDKQNYYGEEYHEYRKKQIEANEFWIKKYL